MLTPASARSRASAPSEPGWLAMSTTRASRSSAIRIPAAASAAFALPASSTRMWITPRPSPVKAAMPSMLTPCSPVAAPSRASSPGRSSRITLMSVAIPGNLHGDRPVPRLAPALGDRDRLAEVEALRHVDAELAQQLDRGRLLDVLGDRLLAQTARDLDDCPDRELVGVVARQVADEVAVDLDQVEGQVLEVVEGPEPDPVVVDRDRATELRQPVGEGGGRLEVADRRRLGDLEGDRAWEGVAGVEGALDVLEHPGVGDRAAREVDVQAERQLRRAVAAPASLLLTE